MLAVIHITPYAEPLDKQFGKYLMWCAGNGKKECEAKSLAEFKKLVEEKWKK